MISPSRPASSLSCAVSAGIHAALAPEHFGEGTAAGVGFLAAAVGLAALAVILTLRPPSAAALGGSAVLLAGLIVAYSARDFFGPTRPPSRAGAGRRRSHSSRRRSRRSVCSRRFICSGSVGAQSCPLPSLRKEPSREHSPPSARPARAHHLDRPLQRALAALAFAGGHAPMRTASRAMHAAGRRVLAGRSSPSAATCASSGRTTSPGRAWP